MTTSGRRNDRSTRDSDRGDSRLSARDRQITGTSGRLLLAMPDLEVVDWMLQRQVLYMLQIINPRNRTRLILLRSLNGCLIVGKEIFSSFFLFLSLLKIIFYKLYKNNNPMTWAAMKRGGAYALPGF